MEAHYAQWTFYDRIGVVFSGPLRVHDVAKPTHAASLREHDVAKPTHTEGWPADRQSTVGM